MMINPVIGSLCCFQVFKSTIPLTSSSVKPLHLTLSLQNVLTIGFLGRRFLYMLRLLMCSALFLLKFLHRSILPLSVNKHLSLSPSSAALGVTLFPWVELSFHQGFSFSALIIRGVKDLVMSGSLSSFVARVLVSFCSLSLF